ncbi:alginate lyase [Flammeovirga sp. MY04]|uniref:polysaccharide lyase 6 family protein n=1 Tax=Flammeovirga sp. MY04 TaxID=1191459 RepID=UPI0009FD93FC|nr:polysaccharide lyase 6 family protein [Flammeovirga sp. MY04]ANQ49917.2 alginate lyase [Flammeovirga sp. MY04]
MKNFTVQLCTVALLTTALIMSFKSFTGDTVTTVKELEERISNAQPGDTIVMAAQTWKDVKIKFKGEGTEERPIVLKAEKRGETLLTGNSSLEIGGNHLVVDGLIFKDGYAKGRVAVRFKIGDVVAKNSRLTNVVMDHYNPADRFEKTSWVELYGQNNEIDHCYFGGKLNAGVLMAVKLNNLESRHNKHHIHHNYFGKRPKLGSNGGETLRVGVSTYCEESSETLIENNYFDHVSGEVEIVSIKSSDNIIRGNIFEASEGVLALRHGDRNIVENNYFFGHNLANAGGVRVINGGHIVRNNYFQDLGGKRFFGPLPIMNGVPNSLPNRYIRAHHATIEGNHFFNTPHLELCVGSDRERTQIPDHITIKNNVFYNPKSSEIFTVLDDISGFTFKGNKYKNDGSALKYKAGMKPLKEEYTKNAEGLYESKSFKPELPVKKEECGPAWYTPIATALAQSNQVLKVGNFDELVKAIETAENGATVEVTAPSINFTKDIHLTKNISIVYNGSERTQFYFEKNQKQVSFFVIENGGSLNIRNIDFKGRSKVGISKAGISTSKSPMIQHYTLTIDNCAFHHFDAADYTAFRAFTSTFADRIEIKNSEFYNISGVALNINGQTEQLGRYSAEEVVIENCKFTRVMTGAMEITRLGNDESTTGPYVSIKNCDFVESGNKELGSVVLLWGVQSLDVDNLFFYNAGTSGRTIRFEDPNWAVSTIDNILSIGSGRIESYYPRVGKHVTTIEEHLEEAKAYDMKREMNKGFQPSK